MTEETEESLFTSPAPMVVSMDLELSALGSATRGAEILTDLQLRKGLMDEDMERDAPESVLSILSLVGGRIDQLRRALRGEENPSHLLSPLNAVSLRDVPLAELDSDVMLFPWDVFRGAVIVAHPSPGVLSASPDEVRKQKAKGAKAKGSKGAKAKGAKAKEPQGSLSVVPSGEPKDPPPETPPSSPESH